MFKLPSYEWKPVVHMDKVRIMAGNGGCWIADVQFGRSRPLASNGRNDAAAICAVPEMYAALRRVAECELPDDVKALVTSAIQKADRSI
ncbi:MAG: hypothetical protein RLZZ408_148 [Verrucomicrobiota bacterium]|jgi:hypothetical protein